MTSYTQNDYYFNEIDALSCNNRPISSTLRSKSTYERQTEDDTASYDLYGNQEYNDKSSSDSYNHHQRSSSTMATAGNYNAPYYSNDYNQYCKNVITTDNLMYHRDACSGDSSDRYDIYSTTLDYGDYDNLRGEFINYGSPTGADGNGRTFTSLGDSTNNKILPEVTTGQHSDNMWDGMYGSGHHRHSNVSLPSTPTFRYNGESVGGREMGSNNGDWDRGFIANGVKAQLNGHRHYEHSGGRFYGCKPPERILPLPQSQPQTYKKKSLKQQFFQDNTDNMATTTTSMSASRNQINLDYKRATPVSSITQNPSPHNLYYDNGSLFEPRLNSRETDYNNSYSPYESRYLMEPRPHTAMQSTDDYNDFDLNSMDNMSTYSDTTVPTATTYANQHKLQDLQKCRYSIIMAMTTASVIASGETRIPQHLLKKTTPADISATSSLSKANTSAGMTSSLSYRYDDSSGFVGVGSNTIKNNANGSNSIGLSTSALPPVTLSTAASASVLLLSSASPIVADCPSSSKNNTNTTTATESNTGLSLVKNLTSRKLPKHHTGRGLVASKQLPQSPPYPLSHTVSSKTLPVIPQTSPLKAADDALDKFNITSSILSTTSATSTSTSTTSSSISSTFSLLSYQNSSITSSPFTTTATKTDATAATSSLTTTTTTTSAHSLPNNNNDMNTDTQNYDNFSNFKNNNFFNNNVQNTDDKYSIEYFRISKQAETDDKAEASREEEESIYHLSTMPSRLNSLAAINETSSLASHQFENGTAFDSLISLTTTAPAATTNATTAALTSIIPTSPLAKTTASSVTATDSTSNYGSDYQTSFDYADYLKPYTLLTFCTSSDNTNLQFTLTQSSSISHSSSYLPYPSLDIHTDYLTYSPSIISTDTSTTLSTTTTTFTSSSTTTSANSTTNAATILAINNRGLNNIATALNLSDNNISRKSSISSPVTKIASPSNSVVPITSIHGYEVATTTTAPATTATSSSSHIQTSTESSSLNSLATYFTQVQGDSKNEKNECKSSLDMQASSKDPASSLSYLDKYDNYMKDYKLDLLISASPISATASTSSPTTHTSAATATTALMTASSSTLNKSWPTSTMMSPYTTTAVITTEAIETHDNNCYKTNNNEDDTSSSVLSIAPDYLFTTTKTAPSAEYTSTSRKGSLTTTAATTTPALYADYLKDYSIVTASSFTPVMSEMTEKPSQELPAYIMDFLITPKSDDYTSSNYLNLYKIKEDTIVDTTPDTSSLKATNNNNNIMSSHQTFLSNIPATTHDTVLASTAATTTATISAKETTGEITPSSMSSVVTTHTTSGLVTATSSPTLIATRTITDNQLTANTALKTVDFDDNFYSSFSVNLNSLMVDTATTTAISTDTTSATHYGVTEAISTTEVVACTTSSHDTNTAPVYLNSEISNKLQFNLSAPLESGSESTDIVGVAVEKSAATTAIVTSTMQSSVTSAKSLSSTQKPTTAGIKATSMLGGLSQSLKGGLDGVLAAAGSNEPQQQKRGFGFGLASKFVPNVGGLLSSATKTTAPGSTATTTTTTQPAKAVSAVSTTAQSSQITESYNNQVDYNYDYANISNSTNFVPSTLNDGYYNDVSNSGNVIVTTSSNKDMDFVEPPHTTDIYGDQESNGGGGLYYNSSQPTYYHMTSSLDYAHDEMANHYEQMGMYDGAATEDINVSKECYADDTQSIDMYDSYSEYQSVTTSGHLIDTSTAYSMSNGTVPSSTMAPASTSIQSNNSTTVTAAKKATSSLFSSLTNVASQISQQTSTSAPPTTTTAKATTCGSTTTATSTKVTSGGGMFGSIFGKAAAAMQSATQVVNQGASIASTKVQKNLQPTAAVSLLKRVPTTEEQPATCTAATVTVTEHNYQKSVMAHQDSLASPYTSSLGGNDYDNSNIPNTDDGAFDHHIDEEEYYYSNQNQPNQLVHQNSQQKLLPTVPPGGGSTGKKLPTINDKSGCLVKQQPTEIYEEDTEVLVNKSQPYLKRVPTYDIDSEQADYYMDTQPVAPSAKHMAANGYYEHINNGSYDYRDDYFNEEDELKYLEKENIQDKEDAIYTNKQHQQHQQHQLRQIHKQSSLQYVVDDDYHEGQNGIIDEYTDEMYHSEDSGNYLDESSSGSVKGLEARQQQVPSSTTVASSGDLHHQAKTSTSAITTTTTTASASASMALHQQIKKQDSIILEDEKDELSSIVGHPDAVASPSKSLSRKSSRDILDIEDDQMGDLQMVSANLRSSQLRKTRLTRGETEEVVGGHMQIMKRKTEATAKQRWQWACHKIILQLNVSRILFLYLYFK